MLLCKKIRLVVSRKDAETLEFMQGKCRGLYNWWIGRLRSGEKWKLYEAKKTLQDSKRHDPELNQVYGKLLAEVYFRIDKAMQAFFRRLKAGETPGFPRWRPRHAFFTLCYPASYLTVDGLRLVLPTGGRGNAKICFVQEMPLYKRTYKCPCCGMRMDRDANSARNILLRFLARLAPHRLSQVCGVLGSRQAIDTFTHV